MQIAKDNSANTAIVGIYNLLILSFVILTLYFAQTIVIPLTIAALLTFLLSPFVTRLERWFGRVFSILLVVIVVFSIIGFTGYVVAKQFILLGSNFQDYNKNIQAKLEVFQFPEEGIFHRVGHAFEELKVGLFGESNTTDTSKGPPVEVKFVDLSSSVAHLVESFFGSFFNILASMGIVFLLVIFMLLNREDIRGRIIKLIGQRRISSTSSAMAEASDRVFAYLSRQFIVNVGFGICVSTGLYFIGIPNVFLWGFLATILRFIPYIGPWIAAIIPIALSFIITSTWSVPLLTISFFILLEFITAYVIEPFYYGVGTGVSSFALILAAIFWTWLWGPLGLLLSTPLTVCLVVIGQHVTNMNFLRVLLSQEQALTPAEECYHRLLSYDSSESLEVVESYLKKNSVVSLYDSVLIPIITQTEIDFHLELIDGQKKESVYQSIFEILEYVSISEQKETAPILEPKTNVLCVPARTMRDELGVNLLAQLLVKESFDVHHTTRVNVSEIFELIEKRSPDLICIVGVAPLILSHTRFLCTQLHQRRPQLPVVVCLWGLSEASSKSIDKLSFPEATRVVFSAEELVKTLQEMQANNSVK